MIPTFHGESGSPTFHGGRDDRNTASAHVVEEPVQPAFLPTGGRDAGATWPRADDPDAGGVDFPRFVASGPSVAAAGTDLAASASHHMAMAMERFTSFAADAKLGAQVARVRLGIDAKVRKACVEAPFLSRFGLGPTVVTTSSADAAEADGQPDANVLIQTFKDSQEHLKKVLAAMEDYQRHRQGLADAGHRLGIALLEASQRASGREVGEALRACGVAHQQAAARRNECHAMEDLHVLSKLRAHHGKAAADCRKAVLKYESALQECKVLEQARAEAQRVKDVAGNSLLTPTVEGDAEKAEESARYRLREASGAVRGKLSMFQAKHAVDYAASLALHMKSVIAEEDGVVTDLSAVRGAADTILMTAPQAVDMLGS